jgi:hypothetical protein
MGQIWMIGDGHLLIENTKNQRIGFVGEELINEIPYADSTPITAGLASENEPIYTIPMTDTYSIHLDGQTLTQTTDIALGYFAPGFSISIEGALFEKSTKDIVSIPTGGNQLSYYTENGQETNLAITQDKDNESFHYQLTNVDIGANQSVTMTNDIDTGRLVFNNGIDSNGSYDLNLKYVNTDGFHIFRHQDISISSNATHSIDYRNWDGFGPMTLYVDNDSDGIVDETYELENQPWLVFLPLNTK